MKLNIVFADNVRWCHLKSYLTRIMLQYYLRLTNTFYSDVNMLSKIIQYNSYHMHWQVYVGYFRLVRFSRNLHWKAILNLQLNSLELWITSQDVEISYRSTKHNCQRYATLSQCEAFKHVINEIIQEISSNSTKRTDDRQRDHERLQHSVSFDCL